MSIHTRYYSHGMRPFVGAAWKGYAYPGSKVNAEVSGFGVDTSADFQKLQAAMPPSAAETYLDAYNKQPTWLKVARTVVMAGAVYHGYKRTGSVGWAILYGALGSLVPYVAVPVMVAQGFGKPKAKK
jgi:hypothetical protein